MYNIYVYHVLEICSKRIYIYVSYMKLCRLEENGARQFKRVDQLTKLAVCPRTAGADAIGTGSD